MNVIAIIIYLGRCFYKITTPRIFCLSRQNWTQSN